MKYRMTILATFLLTTQTFGQITWGQSIADTARGWETEDYIGTKNEITFKKAGQYRWVKTVKSNCEVEVGILDNSSCGLPSTDSAEFWVDTNASFKMICYFYPNNKCCPEGAVVSIKVFKIDELSITTTNAFVLDLWCSSLAVTNTENNLIEIAPNPATDMIHILNINKIDNVTISNGLGETVIKATNSNRHIDISGLKSGIYWITVKNDNSTMTKKFIKL